MDVNKLIESQREQLSLMTRTLLNGSTITCSESQVTVETGADLYVLLNLDYVKNEVINALRSELDNKNIKIAFIMGKSVFEKS